MWSTRLKSQFSEVQKNNSVPPSLHVVGLYTWPTAVHVPTQPDAEPFTAQHSSVVLTPLFFLSACCMNVHHKCQTKVANLCGVNQKLMAEALALIGSTQQVSTLSYGDVEKERSIAQHLAQCKN